MSRQIVSPGCSAKRGARERCLVGQCLASARATPHAARLAPAVERRASGRCTGVQRDMRRPATVVADHRRERRLKAGFGLFDRRRRQESMKRAIVRRFRRRQRVEHPVRIDDERFAAAQRPRARRAERCSPDSDRRTRSRRCARFGTARAIRPSAPGMLVIRAIRVSAAFFDRRRVGDDRRQRIQHAACHARAASSRESPQPVRITAPSRRSAVNASAALGDAAWTNARLGRLHNDIWYAASEGLSRLQRSIG